MSTILYAPDELRIDAAKRQTLLNAALAGGVPHMHVCGGLARCSTCRVIVIEGHENIDPPNAREQALAARLNLPRGVRIACQATVHGPVRVRRLVLDDEDTQMLRRQGPADALMPIGEEIPVAVLFADIRGFTPFAETLLPYDVIHLLNRYFEAMGRIIAAHGGFINNTMGDGLMALFGVDGQPAAPLRAVRAALAMLDGVANLQPYLVSAYGRGFDIGIGIHCGEAVVGPLGAADGKRVTAIGDTVNLASRIESVTKDAGARVLVSETVWQAVQDEAIPGRTARTRLKGKTGEYTLYEVVGLR
jgi:adenylate cyclase